MQKEYKYRGVAFRKTDLTGYFRGVHVALYEIMGIKSAKTKPLLKTVKECREYIDDLMANVVFDEILGGDK